MTNQAEQVPPEPKVNRAFKMDAVIGGMSTRRDGSLSMRIESPELTSEQKLWLFECENQVMTILMQPHGTTPDMLVEVKPVLGAKTPSQRLRAVIFVEYQQRRKLQQLPDSMNAEEYYVREMERIIEYRKGGLSER